MNIDQLIGEEKGEKVGEVIGERARRKGLLIPLLHRIQGECGHLPREALEVLSERLSLPLAEVYGVASFYRQFHFSPRGRKIVKVCTGTACHVRGAGQVLDSLKDHFNVEVGQTTEDLALTLETVGCVGCCGLAPVATVNEGVVGEIDLARVPEFVKAIEED